MSPFSGLIDSFQLRAQWRGHSSGCALKSEWALRSAARRTDCRWTWRDTSRLLLGEIGRSVGGVAVGVWQWRDAGSFVSSSWRIDDSWCLIFILLEVLLTVKLKELRKQREVHKDTASHSGSLQNWQPNYVLSIYICTYLHGTGPFLISWQCLRSSINSSHFMETECSLPYAQQPDTWPYPAPAQSSP